MPSPKKKELSDEDYLDLFKIGDKKYLLGIYQDGITVYKQQIRALNIFQALFNTKKIKPGYTIGIIGGGVAGLTFAAACLKSGIAVQILEKHSTYLPMQSGCDIRRIHPNIYEWPEKGSQFPHATLPVLTWKHDTASNVCKQILTQFKKIEEEAKTKHGKAMLFDYMNCNKISSIEAGSGPNSNQIKVSFTTSENNLTFFYDVLIFAVGYGIEKGSTSDGTKPSYWRNDALGQSFLTEPSASFLVSGDGDGGLIDLCRLLILDFSYELILQILKNNENYSKLESKLLDIRKRGINSDNETFLHDEFSKIESEYYNNVIPELEKRKLLRGNKVFLNSRKATFSQALDFKRVSLLNAFIAFILHRQKKFEFISGDCDEVMEREEFKEFKKVIRHGTDKESVFKDIPLSNDNMDQLKKIEEAQKKTFNNGIVEPRYKFADLIKLFYPPEFKNRIEYLTSDTETFSSYFSNLLYKGINSQNEIKDFRITLHRVISLEEKIYFQQITPYPGNKDNRYLGRVHPLDRGIVGVAIKTGKPVLLTNENQTSYEKIFSELNLEKEYLVGKQNESALAIPIIAPVRVGKKEYEATNLVLYIDAPSPNFFTSQTLGLIVAILSGFLHSINEMLVNGKVTMEPIEFMPPKFLNQSKISKFKNKKCYYDLTGKPCNLAYEISKLKFKEFLSFDLNYNSLPGV